jgi:integral membrane protein (TIGR01906 family)
VNLRWIDPIAWIITLITPLLLIGLALRLLLTPLFLQIEYQMPYFPADEYGFTQLDRLHWSRLAMDYLVIDADNNYLGDLKFDDGSPLYSKRELQHMEDVKSVVLLALRTWYIAITLAAALGLWSWRSGWLNEYLKGLQRGGWFMIGLATFVGLIVALGIGLNPEIFWGFFTGFHQLFFEGNSWLFAYSDTLIRLFPIRFWQDAFLISALISSAGGLLLVLGIKSK